MSIAIYDIEQTEKSKLFPFCINHASFEIKVGMYTNFERIKLACLQSSIRTETIYLFVRDEIKDLIKERYPDCIINPNQNIDVEVSFSGNCVVKNVEEKDEHSINYLWDIFNYNQYILEFDIDKYKLIPNYQIHDSVILVKEKQIFINENSNIKAGVILDIRNDEDNIVIGKNVTIDVGAIIQGNVFIDDNSYIAPGSKIKSGTFIGKHCKVGGEVSCSVISDYSNKGHDGFLGHSFIGEWVNLGAGTNNSNLKNNYNNVKFNFGDGNYIDTGQQFLGAFVGDYSRFGISTMLNTGTHVGIGSNLFDGGFQDKYIVPFSWGREEKVDFEKFIDTCRKMKYRRGKEISSIEIQFLEKIYYKNS